MDISSEIKRKTNKGDLLPCKSNNEHQHTSILSWNLYYAQGYAHLSVGEACVCLGMKVRLPIQVQSSTFLMSATHPQQTKNVWGFGKTYCVE